MRIVSDTKVALLLPMTDASATALLPAAEALGARIPFPPKDVWEEVTDKGRLMTVAAELGVPVPRQAVANDAGEARMMVRELAHEVGFPLILKPHRSVVLSGGRLVKLGVGVVADETTADRARAALPAEAYPLLLQQRIEGPGLGGFFLARAGEVLAHFSHQRLREKPPTGGVSVLCESAPLRDDVRRHSEALLRHFSWTGVAMVEFKEDARTGTPYLMEINGRFWGSLQLAIDAGVDFPTLLVRMALGEKVAPVTSYREGIRSRWLLGDLDHLLWILRAPHDYRDRNPELPGRLRAITRFLVPWHFGERLSVFRPSDPRPFLRECKDWIAAVLGRN